MLVVRGLQFYVQIKHLEDNSSVEIFFFWGGARNSPISAVTGVPPTSVTHQNACLTPGHRNRTLMARIERILKAGDMKVWATLKSTSRRGPILGLHGHVSSTYFCVLNQNPL